MGYNMKKIIWWIIALLCTGSLLYYGYSLYTGTKFKEENGTNTNPASKDLEEFYNELEEYYPEFYKNIATSIRATYVIPGLVQAETIQSTGEEEGDSDQTEDMTPQGLSFLEDYVVISAYSNGGGFNSVLWVLDKKTGKYIKTIVLPTTSHVGGIAYDHLNNRLWITTTEGDDTSQISALNLNTIKTDQFSKTKKPVEFDFQVSLGQIERSSYMAYDQEKLLVGYFDKDDHGHLGIFQLDSEGYPTGKNLDSEAYQPTTIIDTPDQIQGIAVHGHQILLSQSYGNEDSKILWFDFSGYNALTDLLEPKKELVAPPYMQQIQVEGDLLYLLFESSAFKYRINPTVTSMDRVVALSLGDVE